MDTRLYQNPILPRPIVFPKEGRSKTISSGFIFGFMNQRAPGSLSPSSAPERDSPTSKPTAHIRRAVDSIPPQEVFSSSQEKVECADIAAHGMEYIPGGMLVDSTAARHHRLERSFRSLESGYADSSCRNFGCGILACYRVLADACCNRSRAIETGHRLLPRPQVECWSTPSADHSVPQLSAPITPSLQSVCIEYLIILV